MIREANPANGTAQFVANTIVAIVGAMQIYKASGYAISPVRFYESNEVAMNDMKRLAEAEQTA